MLSNVPQRCGSELSRHYRTECDIVSPDRIKPVLVDLEGPGRPQVVQQLRHHQPFDAIALPSALICLRVPTSLTTLQCSAGLP
eukprot:9262357-Pyramimonas_sp.AAC.1